MENLIDNINNTKDLKKLSYNKKYQLSDEIRKYIIEVVSENGGHLASNLGVVELTIALHSVFDLLEDKICLGCRSSNLCTQNFNRKKRRTKNFKAIKWYSRFPKSWRKRSRLL